MLVSPIARVNFDPPHSALLAAFVGRLIGRNAVITLEPAAEIDLRAARRTERAVRQRRRFAADRAAAQGRDRRIGGHRFADIITPEKFEIDRVRGSDRRR